MSSPEPSEEIRPQPGPQEQFLALPPDVQIAIYGGAAGGGKTWALLMEPIYHIKTVPGFGAVIFRRTFSEISNEGGLWDSSYELYPLLGGVANQSNMSWTFPPYGNSVSFAHMQHAKDRFNWQGAQIALEEFDELATFEEEQFWFMLSRNRSMCGVKPYIRASTNPDSDSWVAKFISHWIDDNGFAIEERAGQVHWFIRDNEKLVWDYDVGGLPALKARYPDQEPLSVTFIPAKLDDNLKLISKDPGYRSRLQNLTIVERERLLSGNWKIRPAAGLLFDRSWFEILPEVPHDVLARVRYWDKAGTPGSGSWTVGVKMALTSGGKFIIEHVVRGQWLAHDRNKVIRDTAYMDGTDTIVYVEQEPGSGGKESAEISQMELAQLGFACEIEKVTGDKVFRAGPMSWHAKAGNVKIVMGTWNEPYLDELYNFPNGRTKDQADGSSGAFNALKKFWEQWATHLSLEVPDEFAGSIPADEIGERFL